MKGKNCKVDTRTRLQCSVDGINSEECETSGCCWDNNKCYLPKGHDEYLLVFIGVKPLDLHGINLVNYWVYRKWT